MSGGNHVGGESRAVDAVAAGAAAHDDDAVARFSGPLRGKLFGEDADGAAEDQRIADVTVVKVDRPIDGGDAHAIAIIANASHHALSAAARVNDTVGKLLDGSGRVGKAEDICIGKRTSAQAGPHDITNAAADTRGSAAVGLNGARPVVRFHLHANREVFVEFDDTGIVLEHGECPGLIECHRALEDGRFDEIIDRDGGLSRVGVIIECEIHRRLERLVNTVLGPGLRKRFKFGIRRIALL